VLAHIKQNVIITRFRTGLQSKFTNVMNFLSITLLSAFVNAIETNSNVLMNKQNN